MHRPGTSRRLGRAFGQALATLPHVREVTLTGYEGDDRALFDVHLIAGTA